MVQYQGSTTVRNRTQTLEAASRGYTQKIEIGRLKKSVRLCYGSKVKEKVSRNGDRL